MIMKELKACRLGTLELAYSDICKQRWLEKDLFKAINAGCVELSKVVSKLPEGKPLNIPSDPFDLANYSYPNGCDVMSLMTPKNIENLHEVGTSYLSDTKNVSKGYLETVKCAIPLATLLSDKDGKSSIREGELIGSIPINIDLANYPDKEILKVMPKLLKAWRSELDIAEPASLPNPRKGDREKFLDYKILPLYDLQLWLEFKKAHIKLSVLIVTLFPYGEFGEGEYRNVITKFKTKIEHPHYQNNQTL